jgi:hypothetical protein
VGPTRWRRLGARALGLRGRGWAARAGPRERERDGTGQAARAGCQVRALLGRGGSEVGRRDGLGRKKCWAFSFMLLFFTLSISFLPFLFKLGFSFEFQIYHAL